MKDGIKILFVQNTKFKIFPMRLKFIFRFLKYIKSCVFFYQPIKIRENVLVHGMFGKSIQHIFKKITEMIYENNSFS